MRYNLIVAATMLSVITLAVRANVGSADDARPPEAQAVQVDRRENIAKREKAFTDLLTGCVLVGQFTIDGKPLSPKPERYEIKSVAKIEGNMWLITARIKYGQVDADFPISLPIEWADDDTPVMILDDLTIPLLGTFGGRVMFHGDRYVATWQHGKVGGHMFGRIERAKLHGDSKREAGDSKQSPEKSQN
jgi:hypothetical protein